MIACDRILREVLRGTDGFTITELAGQLGISHQIVNATLKCMPDVYIDRWAPGSISARPWLAVWCVVDVPPNCPMPGTP